MAQRQFKSSDTSIWADKFGDGSAGAVSINTSTDATANTTFSATSGATSATAGSGTGFAAGNLILIHQTRDGGAGAGAWELNKISSVGGGTNWTLAYATIQAYDTTAQVYLLKQYTNATINSGQTLTSSAWDGTKGGIVAFLCNGTFSGTGTIDLKGKGFLGFADNPGGSDATGEQAEGTSGGGHTRANGANGNGAGGGTNAGGSNKGGGGGGGNGATGTAGANNGATGGVAGASAGNVGLTVMVFGGGGGQGGVFNTGSCSGGFGGGILLVIAKNIDTSGMTLIKSDGSDGTTSGNGNLDGGGGGGAGGSVLLKGQSLILGTAKITAAAGANAASGGAGAVGRIHADYSLSVTGTTSPTLDSTQDNIFNSPAGIMGSEI